MNDYPTHTRPPQWVVIPLLGLLLLSAGGCASQRDIEAAHDRGAKLGIAEGREVGEAEGFAAGFEAAYEQSYKDTIDYHYLHESFRRIPFYCLVAMVSAFIVGFVLQWIVFFIIRRVGVLRDIDWMILPEGMTGIDLQDMLESERRSAQHKLRSGRAIPMVLLTVLSFNGCKNEVEEAWQRAYSRNYSAGHQEGWGKGITQGRVEGEARGKRDAERHAETGRAFRLYYRMAGVASLAGAMLGIAIQYITLLYCGSTSRLPELWAVAFVPAMTSSSAYRVLEKKRQLMIWWTGELRKIQADRSIRVSQIQAKHDLIVKKLAALSSLEEISRERLIDVARLEIERIVSATGVPPAEPKKHICHCPHCNSRIRYTKEWSGKAIDCPGCSKPFQAP